MADDIYILGITMTKFGKHPDKDTVDLAAEATTGALADGGVSMKDMGVLAAGNLMNASAGIGQQLQKQIGQTGIPVYNVANACATGATALRTAILDRETHWHGSFHEMRPQLATFGRQLRKYGRDMRDNVGGVIRRDGTRRDLGYPRELPERRDAAS